MAVGKMLNLTGMKNHACLYNECLFSLEAVHGERVNMGFSSQTVRSLRLGD